MWTNSAELQDIYKPVPNSAQKKKTCKNCGALLTFGLILEALKKKIFFCDIQSEAKASSRYKSDRPITTVTLNMVCGRDVSSILKPFGDDGALYSCIWAQVFVEVSRRTLLQLEMLIERKPQILDGVEYQQYGRVECASSKRLNLKIHYFML